MGDDSLPPDSIEKRSDQGGTNDETGERTPENRFGLIDALESASGLVVGMVGFALADSGYHTWALGCYYIAIILGVVVLHHHVKRRWLCPLLTAAVTFLFGFLIWPKNEIPVPPPDRPKPILAIFTSHNINEYVVMTNKAFIYRDIPVDNSKMPYVFLPISDSETNLGVTFFVQNSSASSSLEGLELTLLVPPKEYCGIDKLWIKERHPEYPKAEYFTWQSTKILNSDKAETAPPICLFAESSHLWRIPCGIWINAKDFPRRMYSFWLVIGPEQDSKNRLHKAQVVDGDHVRVYSNGVYWINPE